MRDVPCSWLDVGSVQARDTTVDVALRGVSGKPDKAKSAVGFVLEKAGLKAGDIDFSGVKQIAPTDCAPIDAFRQVRDYGGARLATTQRQYELKNVNGQPTALPEVQIDLNGFGDELALFGLEESGEITALISNKGQMNDPSSFEEPRPGVKSFGVETTHQSWSGLLLLKGKGPFDPALIAKPPGEVSESWVNRFLSTAKAQGWRSEMIWYRTADEKPG